MNSVASWSAASLRFHLSLSIHWSPAGKSIWRARIGKSLMSARLSVKIMENHFLYTWQVKRAFPASWLKTKNITWSCNSVDIFHAYIHICIHSYVHKILRATHMSYTIHILLIWSVAFRKFKNGANKKLSLRYWQL